jgi:hypothetical protein
LLIFSKNIIIDIIKIYVRWLNILKNDLIFDLMVALKLFRKRIENEKSCSRRMLLSTQLWISTSGASFAGVFEKQKNSG